MSRQCMCSVKVTTDNDKVIQIDNIDGMQFSRQFMNCLEETLWEEHWVAMSEVKIIEVTDYWTTM